jgi:hypothetical protein
VNLARKVRKGLKDLKDLKGRRGHRGLKVRLGRKDLRVYRVKLVHRVQPEKTVSMASMGFRVGIRIVAEPVMWQQRI